MNTERAIDYIENDLIGRNIQILHTWKVAARLFINNRNIDRIRISRTEVEFVEYVQNDGDYSQIMINN